jgi:site-specific recombinase XerD
MNMESNITVIPGAKQGLSISGIQAQTLESNPALLYLMSLGSKKSRQSMMSLLNIVAKMLGQHDIKNCQWQHIRRAHVQAIVAQLKESGRAPSTVNTYLAAMKGVSMEAWTLGLMTTDSYQHIKHIKGSKGHRIPKGRALSGREITALFDACSRDTSAKGVRDAAILGVLLGCGLRRSELVSLSMENMNMHNQSIRVLGKGDKERVAFVPDKSWDRLMNWIETVRGEYEGPIFTRIRRFDDVTLDGMSDQAVYHILIERQKDADIASFAPHDLRRTFASTLLETEDIITVRDAMGHSDVTTTSRYDRRSDDRLKKASQKLNF